MLVNAKPSNDYENSTNKLAPLLHETHDRLIDAQMPILSDLDK